MMRETAAQITPRILQIALIEGCAADDTPRLEWLLRFPGSRWSPWLISHAAVNSSCLVTAKHASGLLWFHALLVTCFCLVTLLASPTLAREAKEYDGDVNYDEAKIPHYDLPALLVTSEGERVETVEEWQTMRRPQILTMFSNLVYGSVPAAAANMEPEYEVVARDASFMDGKATRKDVKIRFQNDRGTAEMHILVFTPNNRIEPAPAIMKHSFNNTQSDDFDEHAERAGRLRNGWPVGDLFDRGFGFVAVYQQDLVGHNEVGFDRGVHRLCYPEGQSFPRAHQWGVLSTVAWGGSRALDYLEQDPEIDARRVAVMGHSKMGKAALWTAARDQRFAMAISAQSGCAGAALWRRKSGETLKKMVTRFPYWLCRNAWKFVEQEDDLPVDQHMLLALMAPRPVYVASGIEDTWADPRGEYASAYHAGEVYRLYGKPVLQSAALPPLGEPITDTQIGYHVRAGGHSVEDYDWQRFFDFAEQHLGQRRE